MKIIKLTQPTFRKYVSPTLRPGYARTLKQYLGYHPDQTHALIVNGKLFHQGTPRSCKAMKDYVVSIRKLNGTYGGIFKCTIIKGWAVLKGRYEVLARDHNDANEIARKLHADATGDDSRLLRCITARKKV